MSTQITCEDLISLAEKNPNGYLLDVRTELEWKTDGKPDGGKLGLRTFYISYLIDTKEGRIINPNFENTHVVNYENEVEIPSKLVNSLISTRVKPQNKKIGI